MEVPLHFTNAEKSPGVKDQGGVVSHVLNEIDITCFPDDLPEFIEVDLGNLSVGNSIHARDLKLPKGVELALKKDENPVVATVVVPQLVTEEEEAAAAAAAVAPSEIPTTEQAAEPKEGEAAEGEKGEKPAAAKAATRLPTKARKKRSKPPRDTARCWARQPGQGVRAHPPQRRLLARGALCAGKRRRAAQRPEVQGARRKAPRRRLASSSAVLHESFRAAGADARRLFRIKPEEVLVVHDELDFPPGTVRLKQGGGIAGHNGLKDISQRLATHDYWLRLGVGKPPAVPKAVTTCCKSRRRTSAPRSTRRSIDCAYAANPFR